MNALRLSYAPSSKLQCSLAVIKMCGIEAICTSDALAETVLTLPAGQILHGDHVIARFLGRTHARDLYGDLESHPMLAADLDQYLEAAANYANSKESERNPLIKHLEARLSTRTFFGEDENPNLFRWQTTFSTLPALRTLLESR